MKPRTGNILVVVSVVLVAFAGLFGYGAWSAYSFLSRFTKSEKDLPDEIRQPKIFKGAEFLAKSEFYKQRQSAFISIIIKNSSIKDEMEKQRAIQSETAKNFGYSAARTCGANLVMAGRFGAQVFDGQGNLIQEITFQPSLEKLKVAGFEMNNYKANTDDIGIVDLDNDGRCEFIGNGITSGATVFNNQGNIIWEYGREALNTAELWKNKTAEERGNRVYVAGAAAGDLNGDGKAEFVVVRKNDGIRAFAQNGNELWFQAEKEPGRDLKIVDLDGDGKTELLEIGRNLRVRNGNGEIIKKYGDTKYRDYSMITGNAKQGNTIQFLDITENKLTVSDENGNVLIEADSPLSSVKLKEPETLYDPVYEGGSYTRDSESVYSLKAVRVSWQKDKPKYLAVLASFSFLSRSNFYVYAPDGSLVYHELLPEDAETIAVLPAANASEEIIIGGKSTIWRFAAK